MFNFEDFLLESKKKILNSKTIHHLLHVLKPEIFGENSLIIESFKKLKEVKDIEEKKRVGQEINKVKLELESIFNQKLQELEKSAALDKFKDLNFLYDKILDINEGSIHPITKVMKEISDIFKKYGFQMKTGPEIETDFYNFTGLNVAKFHPARQMQDTFHVDLKDENETNLVLRTHNTAVTLRGAEGKNPPIRNVSVGKVFRCDSDRTHSPMFHQFELVAIDQDLNLSDLKFYIERLLFEFFENENIKILFRPSFFPFTSPSLEVDINYGIVDGKIKIGQGDMLLEILGAGILHENVLKNMKIDSSKYSGIAFGGGLDRLAMLKYGMSDIRDFFNHDMVWLFNNSFSEYDL